MSSEIEHSPIFQIDLYQNYYQNIIEQTYDCRDTNPVYSYSQIMGKLLSQLKRGGHRVLIFTQMTKVLDVLEAFLNYHNYIYLRLDGSTRVEQRQCLMERFNNDTKYFVFILSTRSGGTGVNLTGADTVIFYDSDWNPTMVCYSCLCEAFLWSKQSDDI